MTRRFQRETPDYALAKREANKLLKEYYFRTPPIDPEVIAEDLGLNVVYSRFRPDVSENLSGYLDIENMEIVVNEAIPVARKIFTIAHELGHFIMHKPYAESNNYKTLPRRDEYKEEKPVVEKEADVFAQNLLMPASMVREYMEYASVKELARIFAVSEAAMRHRLSWL